MSISKATMGEFLLSAQVVINNTINDSEISALVAEYGYGESKLGHGKSLYDKANALFQQQKTEYSEQYAATEALKKTQEEANKYLTRYVKIGRIAFPGKTAIISKLDLLERRKDSLSGWLIQARQFYSNALNDDEILSGFAEYGITREKLDAGLNLVEAVQQAKLNQKKEIGEAQEATRERDIALDELGDWLSDYIDIARIALEETPQLLEKLGIITPS